jgi:hypothetical protein
MVRQEDKIPAVQAMLHTMESGQDTGDHDAAAAGCEKAAAFAELGIPRWFITNYG